MEPATQSDNSELVAGLTGLSPPAYKETGLPEGSPISPAIKRVGADKPQQ
ncbi:hypothetical protein [Endozoicomonas sp. Mp262]